MRQFVVPCRIYPVCTGTDHRQGSATDFNRTPVCRCIDTESKTAGYGYPAAGQAAGKSTCILPSGWRGITAAYDRQLWHRQYGRITAHVKQYGWIAYLAKQWRVILILNRQEITVVLCEPVDIPLKLCSVRGRGQILVQDSIVTNNTAQLRRRGTQDTVRRSKRIE